MIKAVNPNELVQYYIVNKDLGMSPGKIAGQVAHVCRRTSDWYKCSNISGNQEYLKKYNEWIEKYSEKKVILEAHQNVLEKLKSQGFFFVEDNGLTEIPAGSLTVVGLGIMTREDAKSYVKRLQTLK